MELKKPKEYNKIAEKLNQLFTVRNIRHAKLVESSLKEILKFEKYISKEQFSYFLELLNNIKSQTLLKRIIRSILNYNYQQKIEGKIDDDIRFIILCASIESFYNFETNNDSESIKKFSNFFKVMSDDNKKILKRKFKSEKNYSPSKLINKFSRYVYEKRSKYLHQGIFFGFTPKNCSVLGDLYQEYNIVVLVSISYQEFLNIYKDCLLENIKKEIQDYKGI